MTTVMTEKAIIDVMRDDATMQTHVATRIYAGKIVPKDDSILPMINVYLDDDETQGGLPSGKYWVYIDIWVRINQSNPQQKLKDIKDRVKALLNQNPSAINDKATANGDTTKVRIFDLVSAVMDTDYVGTLKAYCLSCIFEAIIGD